MKESNTVLTGVYHFWSAAFITDYIGLLNLHLRDD